jgi:hypothetical protein
MGLNQSDIGGTLTEVDIVIICLSSACSSSTVTVQIFSGSPPGTGVQLAQTSLPGLDQQINCGSSTPFTAFTFTTPASVVAGNQYSIIVSTNAVAFTYAICGSTSKLYAGGQSYHNMGGGWVADALLGLDWAFKTFVTTTAPPIPEYPLGLPILAIFMLVAYGVIKRKISTKQLT